MIVVVTGIGGFVRVVMVMVMTGIGFVVAMVMVVTMIVGVFVVAAMIAVIVGLECAAFAELKPDQIVGIHEFDRLGIGGHRLERALEERFQIMTDPEDHIGRLQHRCLGRPHGIGVRRAGTLDDQTRFAYAFHHAGDQRVNGLDGRDHTDLCLSGNR